MIRFMRPEWKAALLVFLLLLVQVTCELALPGYTSSLVDVGVQQGGIENALAKKISAQSMQELTLLADEQGQASIQAAYQEREGLYVLKPGLSKQQKDEAEQAMNLPMALMFLLDHAGEGNGMMGMAEGQATGTQMPQVSKETLLAGLKTGLIKRETVMERVQGLIAQQEALGSQVMRQVAVQFVREEYQRLGENLDNIRNTFLWGQGVQMLGITALMGLAAVASSFVAGRAAARVGRGLRSNVFKRVLSFSRQDVDAFSTASLITRTTNDINQVQQTSVMMLRMLLYAPIMAVGGIIRVTQVKTGMGWIVMVTVAVMMALVVSTAAVVTPKFKILQRFVDRMNLVARENLTGVAVVRAFSRQDTERERFAAANEDLTRTTRFINRTFAMVMPMMMLIMNGVTLLILWFGSHSIDLGHLQVGGMMAFMTYTIQIAMSFMMIAMFASVMLPRAEVSAARVAEVLDREPAIQDADQATPGPVPAQGAFAFENVTFAYPDSKEAVLRDVSFSVEAGQTAAVIGATGSGKSSLLALIPRFFDATEGRILLDGQDIRSYSLSDLRGRIGLTPQKAQLFSGTIKSNIKYADPDMPDERMAQAAHIASAERFIAEREEGYDSEVAQAGANLSGGQKQRLSIARAVAKEPALLLFDDSFSALDYRTDLMVRKALKKELEGTTVLIVAQRIATVMGADKILVLDEGRLVGEGTHEELMAGCPAYLQIAKSQLSEEELSGKGGLPA